jgi:hypothetical protein
MTGLLGQNGTFEFEVVDDVDNFYAKVSPVFATVTPMATPSIGFVDSGGLKWSGEMRGTRGVKGSNHFTRSWQPSDSELSHSSPHRESDEEALSGSEGLSGAPKSGEKQETSVGILLVAILVPLLGVVALIVGLIAWRHRVLRSNGAQDDELVYDEEAPATSPFVTMVNPETADLSDDTAFQVAGE